MSQPYVGQISIFPYLGNFSLRGWQICDGSLLAISQNQALFALISNAYGGNGTSNFAVPDLRGRAVVGAGSGPGLPSYAIAQSGGAATVTLTTANLASHTHVGGLNIVTKGRGVSPESPVAGDYLYTEQSVSTSGGPSTIGLGGVTTQPAGSGQSFSIMPPFLAINYYIALVGIFPTRN